MNVMPYEVKYTFHEVFLTPVSQKEVEAEPIISEEFRALEAYRKHRQ